MIKDVMVWLDGSIARFYDRRRLDRECVPTQFSAGIEVARDDETRPAIQDWNA